MSGPELTKEEAVTFLENTLNVPKVEERIKAQPRALLDEIVTNHQTTIPFNNLRLLSKPLPERRRPILAQVKSDLLHCIGGVCYDMNLGLFLLLKALGFKASIAPSTVTLMPPFAVNHVVVYIRDVEKPGDLFLGEVGVGFPVLRVVDLGFQEESPEFYESSVEYKYVKRDGKLLRMHRRGCPVKAMGMKSEEDFYIGDWRRMYWASLEGTERVEDLDEDFDRVFQDPTATPLHAVIRLVGFSGGRPVVVNRDVLMIGDDNKELSKVPIEGGDEGMVTVIKKYFPSLPEQLIRDALKHTMK